LRFSANLPEDKEKEFIDKVGNLQYTTQRAIDALLRFNMYVLGEYRYEDFRLNRFTYPTAKVKEMASEQAEKETHTDIEAFQKAMAWTLYVLYQEEAKKLTKPRYVFLRLDLGEMWGWRYPEEYGIIYEIWADFGEGLRRIDIIPIKLNPEKIKYIEQYGLILVILEDLLITGLQEQGYNVL